MQIEPESESKRTFNSEGRGEITICLASDVPIGGRLAVDVDEKSYVLFNVDGEFYGLRDLCPHEGAPLSCGLITGAMQPNEPGEEFKFVLEGQILACPWHRWKFEIKTGRSLYGVDRRRVATIPLRVEDGEIVMVLPALGKAAGTTA